MRWLGSCLVLAFLGVWMVQAGEEGLAGNWKVSLIEDGQQFTFWLLRLESKGGKLTGSVDVLKRVPPTTVSGLAVQGDRLQFTLKIDKQAFDFEGRLPKAGGKKIFGSVSTGTQTLPALLEFTTAKDSFEVDREFVVRNPNDPRIFALTLELLKQAKENKAAAKDVQEWAESAARAAENYGPRWQMETSLKLAEALQKDYAAVAVDVARTAEKLLPPKSSADTQLRVLNVLAGALQKAGKAPEAKTVLARIDKMETQAYQEHSKAAESFKVEPFAGRKGTSKRAVLVELFTGAQCPPCVAADLAFDALGKRYKNSEAVLLQYHLHIPGPDALTNGDTELRADYYGKEVRGTPAIFFNGKMEAPGGGGKDDAPDKFKEYRNVVDPLLEKETPVKLTAGAVRQGDKIQIKAQVKDLDKPGDKFRLRLALVEDWVRYRGRNGLAYHHHVVRALPGGAAGLPLVKKDMEQSVEVNLEDLRGKLSKYLDEFAKNEEPFPDGQRPLSLRNLRVVAFVQNDNTNEVLQAVAVPVRDDAAAGAN